jgi:isopentenyl diphosphate isomerase/L-lactate dehydrogenase-like FMN-dependent dehydrogenase
MATEGWQRKAYSIAAMRALARSALPRPVFDFADGAAEDERTLRRNEAAFGEIAFLPKPLNGAATRDLSLTLFGQPLAMPMLIGPTGLAGLFWPDGEIQTARAATKAKTIYCLSHGSVCRLEELDAPDIGPRWMQVFIYRDRGFTLELAQRAKAAGYQALVLTIDNQLIGRRERDLVNGFTIPPRFGARDMLAMATKIGWLLRMRTALPRVTFGNYVRPGDTADIATLAGRMGQLLDPGMNWADVDLVRKAWQGPLLIKGILHPDEAREAIARGVDGLIVSNHGGRQLDGAISAVEALPAIVEAVERRVPILVDGGVRRGADVVRALALGATACLIGRPHLWGLSVAGEAGVAHVLELYRSEMDRVMGLLGARTLADLTPALLAPRRSSHPAA